MPHTVGIKGQVVISKEIRDSLGVKPGWVSIQHLIGDHVELHFLPPTEGKSLKGALSKLTRARVPRGDGWNKSREKAWSANVRGKHR